MTWGKMDDKAHRNRKVRKLYRMGAKGREAYGVWTFRWSWCLDDPDLTGFIPLDELDAAEQRSAVLLCSDLHEGRGLWERVVGGYRIHDFHQYNPTREQADAKREYDRQFSAQRRTEMQGKSDTTPPKVVNDSEPIRNRVGHESFPARVSHPIPIPFPSQDPPVAPQGAQQTGTRPLALPKPSLEHHSGSHVQEVRDGWAEAFEAAGAGAPPWLAGAAGMAAVGFARSVAAAHGRSLREAARAIAAGALRHADPRARVFALSQEDPWAIPAQREPETSAELFELGRVKRDAGEAGWQALIERGAKTKQLEDQRAAKAAYARR